MICYRQLTREQRYQLAAQLARGKEKTAVARALGVHLSTVSRELARNGKLVQGTLVYHPERAHRRSLQRRIDKGMRSRKIQGDLQTLVENKLRLGWSPEQICGRLHVERRVLLSHETIYRHVIRDAKQGGSLRYSLRHGGYGYRRLRKTRYVRLPRSPRRTIATRPKEASDRRQRGHWERDLVLSKQGGPALLLLVERASRYSLIRWIPRVSLAEVSRSSVEALEPFDVRSLTNDNGSEFNSPQPLEHTLAANVFYTDPGKPWQRGSVENTAGLTRQYFRKRQRFDQSAQWLAPAMQHTLNTRPRKCLAYRTPHEVLLDQNLSLFDGPWLHFGLETTLSS